METFAIDAPSEDDLEIYRQIFINAHEQLCFRLRAARGDRT